MRCAAPRRLRACAGDNGVALFVVLIFLLVLTVLGLTAMRSATLGERMASNRVDKALATQAAEAALRDAERDILWTRADGSYCKRADGSIASGCRTADLRPLPEKIHNFGGTSGKCESGQCYHLPTAYFATPVWEDPAMWDKAVVYGEYTGAPEIAAVAAKPKYLIEGFRKDDKWIFRISALGYGADANTRVVLQAIYIPPSL